MRQPPPIAMQVLGQKKSVRISTPYAGTELASLVKFNLENGESQKV
jgi:hypothetical protein